MTPALAIRFAMLVGVLLFGLVTYFARSPGAVPSDLSAERAAPLLWMARLLWGVAIVGCIVLYLATRRTTSPARVATLSIVAWALGETVALFGGAVWFLTGVPSWYLPGVTFLVLTFVAFPGRIK
jgi:hypothetical protein